jgi:ATP-binding cassette subfamily B protein/subfamily B ATP-binding cassette protein MsbA
MRQGVGSQALFSGERAANSPEVARRLIGLLVAHRTATVIVLILGVVIAVASALPPLLIGRSVDRFIIHDDLAGLVRPIALLVLVYTVALIARFLQSYIGGIVGQRILANLRHDLFASLQRQSMSFFDRQQSGDLQSRLVNDVDVVSNVLSSGMMQSLANIVSAIGMLVGMLILDWRLAIVTCLIVPAVPSITQRFLGRARQQNRMTRQTIADVSANLQEGIAGVRVSQAYNRTQINRARFAERNRANRDANIQARAVTLAFSPTMDLLSAVAIAAVVGFGGYLGLHREISVGVIVGFLGYAAQFFAPIQQLAAMFPQMQSGLAAVERIFDLMDAPPDIKDAANPVRLDRVAGRIAFENVVFGYDPNHPVLRDVSFEVEPGQMVAIVGPTGAGKTTIVSLLARMYEVTSGRITVDGIDVRDIALSDLRRQIGVVPQNGFVFNATIRENIRYGRIEATDAEVEAAARLSRAHQFIHRLAHGYETTVGERGGQLSQGQRQLVSIARVLLANPRILILDEATSSVDTRTELLIQDALGELLSHRTSLVIAHRLSTIRSADVVLVIDDGQIVERGTHAELLARGGLYADLYRRQFREPVDIAATA